MYDTLYAMVDREDDLKIGVKSSAILFGSWDKRICAVLQVCCVVLWGLVGWLESLSYWFFLAIFVCIGLFVYQQYLIQDRERLLCFRAFLHNHYVGMVLFLGIVFGAL